MPNPHITSLPRSQSMNTFIVCAAATSALAYAWWTLSSSRAKLHQEKTAKTDLSLPPGPKRRRIAGNALELPTEYAWLVYHEWAKEHGDVMYLEAFGQPMLVLDCAQAVSDLFEKRSASFSSRRIPLYVDDLMGFDFAIVNAPYASRWRRMRKALHPHVAPSALPAYASTQLRGVRHMLNQLVSQPEGFREHNRALFGRIVLDMVYGLRDPEQVSVYTGIVDECMRTMAAAVNPGPHFLLEVIPALKYLPVWHTASRLKRLLQKVLDEPYALVKTAMSEGSAERSIGSLLLNEKGEAHDLNDTEIRDLCAVIYAAGADTTVSALDTFYLAMLLNPSCQRLAQEELDMVVGRNRLPDYNDRTHLPYINALILEILRWNPVTPMAVPHMTTQDEIYRNWRIPAGTVVFGNAWAILHDPSVYPEPEAFRPERFLLRAAGPTPPLTPDNGFPASSLSSRQTGGTSVASARYGSGTSEWAPRPNAPDPRSAAFGFGRRVCPGSHLADQALFAGVASILATFHVAPVHGGEIPQLQDEKGWMTGGYISHPREFECTIKPRHEGVEGLVRAGMEDTGDVF